MKKNKAFLVAMLCALLLQTGCYTSLYVNFGNGTGRKILVKDAQTGQEVQIAPGKFQKVGHGQADLVVTLPDKERYTFTGIKVADPAIDQRYYDPKKGLFGAWSIDLNVLLHSNMDLYVLLPGKNTVDASVPQPEGYPKVGKKMADTTLSAPGCRSYHVMLDSVRSGLRSHKEQQD